LLSILVYIILYNNIVNDEISSLYEAFEKKGIEPKINILDKSIFLHFKSIILFINIRIILLIIKENVYNIIKILIMTLIYKLV